MRRSMLTLATGALFVLPLAACSGSDGSWQDEYSRVMSEQFAKADSEDLEISCSAMDFNELDDGDSYADYLMAQNPDLTLDGWLSTLGSLHEDSPDLTQIVPDDADLAEVLALTGEAHLAACP